MEHYGNQGERKVKNFKADFPNGPVIKILFLYCKGYRFDPGWGTTVPHTTRYSQKITKQTSLKKKFNIKLGLNHMNAIHL